MNELTRDSVDREISKLNSTMKQILKIPKQT